jgi:hypothetical protein
MPEKRCVHNHQSIKIDENKQRARNQNTSGPKKEKKKKMATMNQEI